MGKKSFSVYVSFLILILLGLFLFNPISYAISGTPTIISYQGRLTDASGDLLGGSGTTFYFKFSIWDNATVGSGNRLWPSAVPATTTANVIQGVFNVNIGDTANAYPDPLDYNFNTNTTVYLQVEVSSDNNSSETLSPRQQITASAFSQLAGAVSGTSTPSSFGTTTPIGNSVVTIEASSTSAIPLSIRAAVSQLANLFQIQDSDGTNLLYLNSSGAIFASSTLQVTSNSIFYGSLGVGTTTPAKLFSVQGDGLFSGDLSVANITATGTLTLTGLNTLTGGFVSVASSTVNAQLNVSGPISASSSVTILSTLDVDGLTELDGFISSASSSIAANLNVAGPLSASSTLTVANNAIFNSNVGIGTTTPSQLLSVQGSALFSGDLTLANLIATGTLDITGATTLSDTLAVTNLATLSGGFVSAGASSTNVGTLHISGAVTLDDSLDVDQGGTGQTTLGDGELLVGAGTGGITSTTTANLKTSLLLQNVENTALSTWPGTSNLVTTGALNAGSITSDFGNIDTGASTITTTGLITSGGILATASSTVNADLVVTGVLNASSSATVGGALEVTGASTLTGVVGIATSTPAVATELSVQGNIFLSGNISNVANITATGTLAVTGVSTLSGGVLANASSTLTLLHASTLTLTGLGTFEAGILSQASSTFSSAVRLSDTLTLDASINGILVSDTSGLVSASSTLGSSFIVDTYLFNTGDTASGDYNFTGNLGVGTSTPSQILSVEGGVFVSGTSTLSGLTATGASIAFIDGSDTEPSIRFAQDSDTGFSRNQDNRINLITGGTKSFTFLNETIQFNSVSVLQRSGGGDITLTAGTDKIILTGSEGTGIGTTSPSQLLAVQGNVLFSGNLTSVANITATGTLSLTGTTGTSTIASGQGFTVGTSQLVVIGSNGNVGIGTANPSDTLHVNLGINGIARFNDGSAASGIWGMNIGFLSQSSEAQITTRGSLPLTFSTDGVLNSMTVGTERMRITATGDVGIGVTDPDSLLEVAGTLHIQGNSTFDGTLAAKTISGSGDIVQTSAVSTGRVTLKDEGDDSARILFGTDVDEDAYIVIGAFGGINNINTTGRDLKIFSTLVNPIIYMEEDTGNVGIGETAPGSKLSVSGGGSFGTSYDTTAAPSNGLIVEGNVGIGTTSPSQLLSVQGNAYLSGDISNVANITATGTLDVTGVSTLTGLTNLTGFISSASSSVAANLNVAGPISASSSVTVASTLDIDGLTTLASYVSTASSTVVGDFRVSGNATTSGNLDIGSLRINSEHFTDLTGSGLSISGSALTCDTASGATFGCLAATAWTLFNNKVSTTSIDSFAELNSLVSDKTLVNEEDAVTWDSLNTFSAGIVSTASSTVNAQLNVSGPISASSSVTILSTLDVDGLTELDGFISSASSSIAANLNVAGPLSASSTLIVANNAIFNSNVGIGTTSPSQLLSVQGNVLFSGNLTSVADITATGTLTVSGLTTLNGGLTLEDGDTFTISGDAFTDFTGDATLSLVSGTLRVVDLNCTDCIGTAEISDDYLLNSTSDVMAGTLTADGLTLGANENITLGSQTLDHDGTDFVFNDSVRVDRIILDRGTQSPYIEVTGNKDMGLFTVDTLVMTLREGGKVGIGDSAPNQKLGLLGANAQLSVEESDTEFIRLGVEATGNDMVLGWDDSDDLHLGLFSSPTDTTVDTKMIIQSSGNVGIGTTSPSQLLSVQGSALFSGDLTLANLTATGTLDVTGLTTLTGGFVSSASSSIAAQLNVAGPLSASSSLTVGGAFFQTPGDPVKVGGEALGNFVNAVYVSGKYAYVGLQRSGNREFEIVDISDPTNPTEVSSGVEFGVNANAVYVSGNYAYVGTDGNRLEVIDISNPTSPVNVGDVTTADAVNAVYVSGRYAYVGSDITDDDIEIFDISDPTNLTKVGGAAAASSTNAVYVQGNYAYVGSDATTLNLEIFNISDPTNPNKVGSTTAADTINTIYVSGRYAYVGSEATDDDLEIFDISDPTNPTKVGGVAAADAVNAVYVSGNYAYVGSDSTGDDLEVFDISTPASPVKIAGVDADSVNAIYVSGKYAYIGSAVTGDELEVFDIGGIDAPSASIGDLAAGTLDVTENANIANNLYVGTALNVGSGGIFSNGALSISSTTVSSYFAGNLGIGTTTPSQLLSVQGSALFSGDLTLANLTATGTLDVTGLATLTGGFVSLASSSVAANLNVAGPLSASSSLEVTGVSTLLGNLLSSGASSTIVGTLQVSGILSLDTALVVGQGGTGQTTLGDGELLVGAGTNGITSTTTANLRSTLFASELAFPAGYVAQSSSTVNAQLNVSGPISASSSVTILSTLDVDGLTELDGFISSASSSIAANLNVAGPLSASSTLTVANNAIFNSNVGIGTTTPSQLLSVQGSALFSGNLTLANLTATGTLDVTGLATLTGGFISSASSTLSSNLHVSGILNASSTMTVAGVAVFDSNVGIGTTTPSANLVINGTTGQNLFQIATSTNQNIFVVDANGNVRIGTASSTTATTELEVVGDITSKGTKWTSRTSAADNGWLDVTYGNGLFVAVGQSNTGNRVMTSPDGVNWATASSTADNTWTSVTYGNGLFVAVAQNNIDGNQVMTSPDGINWTSRSATAVNQWQDVTYGNGLFVAVSQDGTNDRVMTSLDGITWTSRDAIVENNWRSITYGNGLFVAASNSGSNNRVMTSPDGINWTSRTSAEDNSWNRVTYGNGLFVAVSDNGTNRVMTSPDGITWASRTSAADVGWVAVTYGNGLFVAVARDSVMTSPDGITWTSRTSAASNGWIGVIYGNGIFVAVSHDGTGDNVMTSGKTESNTVPHNNILQGGLSIFGNVGIGTSTPYSTLSVWGSGTGGAALFELTNNASTSLMTVLENGNVGIGTTTPSQLLSVQGNALFSGNLTLANLTATGTLTVTGDTTVGVITTGNIKLGGSSISNDATGGLTFASSGGVGTFLNNDSANGDGVRTVLELVRTYDGGAGADGIGGRLNFKVETETEGTTENVAQIDGIVSDATAGTVDGHFEFQNYVDGTRTLALDTSLGFTGWKTWTPTIGESTSVIGNGVITARYTQIGKTINYYIKYELGTTSVIGTSITFTLPVSLNAGIAGNTPMGNAVYYDQSLFEAYLGVVASVGGTQVRAWNNAAPTVNIKSTVPFTWVATDDIFITGTYEAE